MVDILSAIEILYLVLLQQLVVELSVSNHISCGFLANYPLLVLVATCWVFTSRKVGIDLLH